MVLARQARSRVHRAAAPGRADRLPAVRGPGGRAGRLRRGRSAPTISSCRPSASWPVALRAGRRSRPVPPVPPGDVARRPVRPARDPFRADLHPDRDPDRARGRLRAGTAARRDRRRARSPTSATARRARATSTRRRTSRACAGSRSSCSARTTDGRSACRRRRRPPARSGAAPRATGSPACGSTGTTCSRCTAATREAVERARSGGGPTLIEALTYRIGAHSTADDARALPRRCRGGGGARIRPDRAVPHLVGRGGPRRRRLRRRLRCRGGDVRARGSRGRRRDPGAARRVGVRLGVRGAAGHVRADARGGARR